MPEIPVTDASIPVQAADLIQNPLLPKVEYPSMDMPEPPVVPGEQPTSVRRPSSDGGQVYDMDQREPSAEVPDPTPGIPRIMVGMPVLSYSHEWVESFMKFWTQCCMHSPKKFEIGFHFVYRKPGNIAAQQLVDVAKFNKCTHLLFIDDDIYDYTIDDLFKLIDAKKDVISGVMYASKFPFAMCCFRRYDTTKKVIDMPVDNSMYRLYEIPCQCPKCGFGLSHWDAKFCPVCGTAQDNLIQPVDLIPFPFTLIKMDVFDKLKKPYFFSTIDYPTDSWFADRCKEAGIQEYAHMGVRLNHNGCNDLTRPHLFQLNMAKNQAAAKSGIVTISPDEMHKHEYMLHTKMKEAENRLRTTINFIKPEINVPEQEKGIAVESVTSVAGQGEKK